MIGKKIKYYRLKSGLTIDALAKEIGCTKAAISLYENDERMPNNEITHKLAAALNISWIKLVSRNNEKLTFNHLGFRKIQKASKKDIELLKLDIESKLADRISIMRITGLDDFKIKKFKKLSIKDHQSVNAHKIKRELGITEYGPIYSLTSILEHAGIIMLSFPCADEIDGVNGVVNGMPYIFFNSKNRTIERQRFTIAHELCHLFFDDETTNTEFEKYINLVAGNFLISNEDLFMLFGKRNRSLTPYIRDSIAKEYKISPSCLINRLYEFGVITKSYQQNYYIQLNKTCGKKNEKTLLDPIKDSEQPTIFTNQVYLALSEELISASRAAEYLDVSLYEVMQNLRSE